MRQLEGVAAISPEDKEVLYEVRDVIRRLVPKATVYLYGSAARGARPPDSDLDLLIVTERRLSRSEESGLADAIYDVELARGAVIATTFYSREEWDAPLTRATPFRTRVEAEAVVV